MCDMPELLMRMQIANNYSLKEMQDMFNQIMASIDKRDGGPLQAGAAALFHFPDVFLKLRDEYMYSLIRKIAEEEPQPPVNPD